MSAAYRAGMSPATFIAGDNGAWRIERSSAVVGDGLPSAARLAIREGIVAVPGGVWTLNAVAGHVRYVELQ